MTGRVVSTTQGRMRFLRRAKIILHAEMNLHLAAFEPAPAALGEFSRLGNLHHAQEVAVEAARRVFFATWHGELDVIDEK